MPTKYDIDALLFVDTNVLLDFYRIRNSDVSMRYLNQLEAHKNSLIIGSQIEMEYKKNRQRAIVESLNTFKTPDWGMLSVPALVSDLQAAKIIVSKRKEVNTQYQKVSDKIKKILADPIHHDPVYQSLQRIFKNESDYNLDRESDARFSIRNLARKRFTLGYPPRKQNDTSFGDAVNWEWIVKCSKDSGKHVVIVTRDTDFGAIYEKKSYLNDWLRQEFSERVSKRRKVILTDRLSEGLKYLHAPVTEAMVNEETNVIERRAEQVISDIMAMFDDKPKDI